MNKKFKVIMRVMLVLGILFTIELLEAKYIELFTTEAYASSDAADKLSSLELEASDGNSLNLYEDIGYEDKLSHNLYVGDIYFAKTSEDDIKINSISGVNSDNVRIFIGDSDKAYKVGDNLSLSKGTITILNVRVYEEEYNKDKCYSTSTYNPYMIIVKNTAEVGE